MTKDDTGEVVGCHATQDAAEAQVAALYANEPGGAMYDAATARAKALRGKPATIPVGPARSLPFKGQLRSQPVDRDGKKLIQLEGYASVVETPYEMWDFFGPYNEIISKGAFDKTLSKNPDVAFLVNHRGVTMARTTNGSLELSADSQGLHTRAWVNPERTDVRDLVLAIDEKNITEMSFAFQLPDDAGEWARDFSEYRVNEADINRGDVSAVNYGANPYTSVAARAREILADLDHLPAGAALAAMARLQHRKDLGMPQSDGLPDTPRPPRVGRVAKTASQSGKGMKLSDVEAWLATVAKP